MSYEVFVNGRPHGKPEANREVAERNAIRLSQRKRHVQLVRMGTRKAWPEILRTWDHGKEV